MHDDLAELFPGRKAKLQKILRYHAFDTMFYRTNDWIHSLRVSWLVEDMLPLAKRHFKRFDAERAMALALVHDDAEILTGDVQAGHKAVMSKRQLEKVHENERRAIAKMKIRYPIKVHGKYSYAALLLEAFEKKTVESQFVSFADKMDAHCESLHEIYAGNFGHLRSVHFYALLFSTADKKFPKLKPMLDDKRSVFTDAKGFLFEHFVKARKYKSFGKPFTKKTVILPSQFPFYDRWRKITLIQGGKEGLHALINQKERLA